MKYLFLFLIPFIVFGASPTRQGTETNVAKTVSDEWTISHTVPATGDNTALLVAISFVNNRTVTATWNGSAMTELHDFAAAQVAHGNLFYIANPDTGTHNIVLSFSNTTQGAVHAFNLKDIVQSSPVDVSGQSNISGASAVNKEITTTVDNTLIVSWVNFDSNTTSDPIEVGQTEFGDIEAPPTQTAGISDETHSSAGAVTHGFDVASAGKADMFMTSLKYAAPAVTEEEIIRQDIIWFQ